MRRGDTKIFSRDKLKLKYLFGLVGIGVPSRSLAQMFGCNESSVRARIRKHHIKRGKRFTAIPRIVTQSLQMLYPDYTEDLKWKTINGKRVNQGFSYKEYLARSKKRLKNTP